MSEQQQPKVTQAVVDFTVVHNAPMKLLLEDGTMITVQLVPVRLSRTDQLTEDGQPMYMFKMQQVIDQIPPDGRLLPEALKGKV